MTEQELVEFLKQRLSVRVNISSENSLIGSWREITVELRLDGVPISTSTETLPTCECEERDR